MRNVEIKAKVSNLLKLIKIAETLSPSKIEIIKQHDTFYNVPNGRLKMRKFEDNSTELIFYDRPDTTGPKISTFEKSSICINCNDDLHNILSKSLGTKKIVKKIRHLFLIGQTRVHIDEVENLGSFMELEVLLRDDQSLEDGSLIAKDLMEKFGINESDLISGAYADMLK